MKNLIIIFILSFTTTLLTAQKKRAEAAFLKTPLEIDGILNETAYSRSIPAKDFLQLQPYNGAPSLQPSKVHFFYDQSAIYVGAMLYDNSPDSIFNFLTERDHIGMSDYFGVYFDPYNKGQLAYGFFITPAGVQTDIKAIKKDYDEEDSNWDAVWESKTRIIKEGWVIEMKIPYAALRFPEKEIHTWGLNIFRNIRRYNSNNSWNLIDRTIAGFIHQQGELTGIRNIKPPVRLSLTPYAATYVEFKEETASTDLIYKGGVDLKYGITESFTLDMMVIPDFGQIQSDDKKLNLSPYELYYDERRQFFTEGTELFERANIFYSRRIGGRPKFSDKADDVRKDNETINNRPTETQLVNATKLSGRTKKGLGMGFLNAMSLNSYAILKDTTTGKTRKVPIQPFTNYNVSVLDYTLKNNSYISLINTNMSMANNPFIANVTASEFQVRDKSKTYAISGKGGLSTRIDTARETGVFAELNLAKNSGQLRYGISQNIYSEDYNPNDMGYLRRNNLMKTEIYTGYRKLEPFGIFRELYSNAWWKYTRVVEPADVYGQEAGFYIYTLFKNNYGMELNGGYGSEKHDYYEPRIEGRFFYEPWFFWYNIEASTDYRKPFSAYFHFGGFRHPDSDQFGRRGQLALNWRIGQHLQLEYDLVLNDEINDYGFVDTSENEDTIYFARRDINLLENRLELTLAINNKLSVRLRGRHHWSGAENKTYYQLQDDGSLKEEPDYDGNHNENFNVFNIDMVIRWVYAPGSELTLGWKNSIFDDRDIVEQNYWQNLRRTFQIPQTNTFSLKVLYYLDYNNLVKKENKN
ncbi:hypothetical protein DMA11_16005 [Marinilabiliaceae bacterium JC017]|nr:hypothetical protein DMA11_16005 [Marinilabiliaceae bacterium JC017]